MIGYWNYTVILTYLSLASSAFGMSLAINERFVPALMCLAVSGLCDAFDGRVARAKKDRTESEKMFGIQLDSLCDVICFGIFPAVISYQLGLQSPVGMAVIVFYCIASVARLAYYNTLEMERDPADTSSHGYRGLPITSIVVIFPMFYALSGLIPENMRHYLWGVMLAVTGGLFISNIHVGKPGLKHIVTMTAFVAALFIAMPFLKMHM